MYVRTFWVTSSVFHLSFAFSFSNCSEIGLNKISNGFNFKIKNENLWEHLITSNLLYRSDNCVAYFFSSRSAVSAI